MSRVEYAAKIREFLADGRWRTRDAIQKGTGLVDHEWNEAVSFLFELQSALAIRGKHDPITVYRLPPPDVDMFGNPV